MEVGVGQAVCVEQLPEDATTDSVVDAILETCNQERHSAGNDLIANAELVTQMVTCRNRLLQMVRNLALASRLACHAKGHFSRGGPARAPV